MNQPESEYWANVSQSAIITDPATYDPGIATMNMAYNEHLITGMCCCTHKPIECSSSVRLFMLGKRIGSKIMDVNGPVPRMSYPRWQTQD